MLNSQTEIQELINNNLYYAKKLARRFYNKRAHTLTELDDLESAAFLGLCEAANRFDRSKDNKFQTYSYLRIIGAMYDCLVTNGGSSRSSHKMLEGVTTKNNGVTLRIARDLRELSRAQSVIEEWGIKIQVNLKKGTIDLLYVDNKLADEKLLERELYEQLYKALSELPCEIKDVIESRFFKGKKLDDIVSENPSFSKSHASRLCCKGLLDLRKKMNSTLQ